MKEDRKDQRTEAKSEQDMMMQQAEQQQETM